MSSFTRIPLVGSGDKLPLSYAIYGNLPKYLCDICGFGSPDKATHDTHKLSHVQATSGYVAKRVPLYYSLDTGKLQPHGESSEDKEETEMVFICILCGFRCASQPEFFNHQKMAHPTRLHCKHCNFKAADPSYLIQHESRHVGIRFKCDKCDYIAASYRMLPKHMATHHRQQMESATNHKGPLNQSTMKALTQFMDSKQGRRGKLSSGKRFDQSISTSSPGKVKSISIYDYKSKTLMDEKAYFKQIQKEERRRMKFNVKSTQGEITPVTEMRPDSKIQTVSQDGTIKIEEDLGEGRIKVHILQEDGKPCAEEGQHGVHNEQRDRREFDSDSGTGMNNYDHSFSYIFGNEEHKEDRSFQIKEEPFDDEHTEVENKQIELENEHTEDKFEVEQPAQIKEEPQFLEGSFHSEQSEVSSGKGNIDIASAQEEQCHKSESSRNEEQVYIKEEPIDEEEQSFSEEYLTLNDNEHHSMNEKVVNQEEQCYDEERSKSEEQIECGKNSDKVLGAVDAEEGEEVSIKEETMSTDYYNMYEEVDGKSAERERGFFKCDAEIQEEYLVAPSNIADSSEMTFYDSDSDYCPSLSVESAEATKRITRSRSKQLEKVKTGKKKRKAYIPKRISKGAVKIAQSDTKKGRKAHKDKCNELKGDDTISLSRKERGPDEAGSSNTEQGNEPESSTSDNDSSVKILKKNRKLPKRPKSLTLQYTYCQKNYKCEHCGFVTYRPNLYQIHLMQHTGQMPFQCRYCPFSTVFSSSYTEHFKRHTGKKFRCDICGVLVHSWGELPHHNKLHHSKHGKEKLSDIKD